MPVGTPAPPVLSPGRKPPPAPPHARTAPRAAALPARTRLVVVTQLHRLLASGQPLTASLAGLRRSTRSPALARTLDGLVADLDAGLSLEQAIDRHPGLFPGVEAGWVAVGERTGNLAGVLDRLAGRLKRVLDLRRRAIHAAAYPVFLLAAACVLLPLPTLFGPCGTAGYLAEAGKGLGLLVLGGAVLAALPRVVARTGLDVPLRRIAFAVPVLGWPYRSGVLADMLHGMSAGFAAGLGVHDTLSMTARSLRDPRAAAACAATAARLEQGAEFAVALGATGLLPEHAMLAIAAGERSGTLADTLADLADEFGRIHADRMAWLVRAGTTLLLLAAMAMVAVRIIGAASGLFGELETLEQLEREVPGLFQPLPK